MTREGLPDPSVFIEEAGLIVREAGAEEDKQYTVTVLLGMASRVRHLFSIKDFFFRSTLPIPVVREHVSETKAQAAYGEYVESLGKAVFDRFDGAMRRSSRETGLPYMELVATPIDLKVSRREVNFIGEKFLEKKDIPEVLVEEATRPDSVDDKRIWARLSFGRVLAFLELNDSLVRNGGMDNEELRQAFETWADELIELGGHLNSITGMVNPRYVSAYIDRKLNGEGNVG